MKPPLHPRFVRRDVTAFIGSLAIIGGSSLSAEVSKETLEAISTPETVETSIGKLEFAEGVMTHATVETLHDNLDRMRTVEVYLSGEAPEGYFVVKLPTYGPSKEIVNQTWKLAPLEVTK